MKALRIPLLLVVAAVLPLLQGCGGEEHPGFSRAIDLNQHLQRFSSGPWEEKPNRMQVRIGPDSLPVTVEWRTARRDAHRGISYVNVVFPPHRKGTYDAVFSESPVNRGTKDAALLFQSLRIDWARNGALAKQAGTTSIDLDGDGTSRVY